MLFLFSRSTTRTKTARAKGVSILLGYFSMGGGGPGPGEVAVLGKNHQEVLWACWVSPFLQCSRATSAPVYGVSDSRTVSEPDWQGRDDILHCITLHTVQRIFMYIISVNPLLS